MIKISKNTIYESHGFKFKNFVSLSLEEQLLILEWRNNDKVRNMMVNKSVISKEDHLAFISSLKDREDCFYWLVIDKTDTNIGVLDLLHVNFEKDEGEMGFYLNPYDLGLGFEFMIECNFFVFSQLKLGNNIVTVNVKNKEIVLFNKYIGATYEGREKIGDDFFYVSKHANGEYLISHYNSFNLLDYAKFIRENKHKY